MAVADSSSYVVSLLFPPHTLLLQSSTNFCSTSSSYRQQFFNCCADPFHGVQTFRDRLLHSWGHSKSIAAWVPLSSGVHRGPEFFQKPISTQFFIAIYIQLPYYTHSTRYFYSKRQQFNFKIQINRQVIELLEHCLSIFK